MHMNSIRRGLKVFAWAFTLGAFLATLAPAPFGAVPRAEASSCALVVQRCARNAAKLGGKTANVIASCRAVRECRQDCRAEKRQVAGACRQDKGACVSDCRRRFGGGRDFRQCRRSCRADKRGCVREARQDKRSCRRVCRETFLTPECRKARFKILGSSLRTIAACAAVATCVKPAP